MLQRSKRPHCRPFLLGDVDTHLILGSSGPNECSPNRLTCSTAFFAQLTCVPSVQTTPRKTSVAVGRICVMRPKCCLECGISRRLWVIAYGASPVPCAVAGEYVTMPLMRAGSGSQAVHLPQPSPATVVCDTICLHCSSACAAV